MSARGSPRRSEDGGTPVEPATVVGRRMAAQMGSVRFGGSGQPVPGVFNAAKGGVVVSARAPRVALEVISLSPRISVSVRSHPRRVTTPGSTASPVTAKQAMVETCRSTASTTSQDRSRFKRGLVAGRATRLAVERARDPSRSRRGLQRMPTDNAFELPVSVGESDTESKASVSHSQGGRATRPHAISAAKPLVLDSSDTGANVFGQKGVSTRADARLGVTPTKTDNTGDTHSFRFMEGTHRRPETAQKRYHVAFHPPASSKSASQTDKAPATTSTRIEQRHEEDAQTSLALSPAPTNTYDAETQGRDVWKSVDEFINQMYEDPPIDLVKSTLFHANLTTDGQSRKRFKQKQRQRMLEAAEELREVKTQQQVERDQIWRRKEQIQALSETIRRRNKKFMRSVEGAETIHGSKSHRNGDGNQHDQSAVSVTARKPPVPRLSGSRGKTSKRKRLQHRRGSGPSDVESTEGEPATSTPAGTSAGGNGAAASILLGDLHIYNSHGQQSSDAHENAPDPSATHRTSDGTAGEDLSLLRGSSKLQSTSRRSATSRKKSPEQSSNQEGGHDPRPSEALDQRRAIAREYMLLQQHQRMTRKSEARQREQMEREKRRQRLEILEMRRLENLKHSRKRRLPPQRVPARHRNKARARAPASTERSPVLAGSDQDSAAETKPTVDQIVPSDDQEQLSDAENDGSQRNIVAGHQQQGPSDSLKSASPFIAPSRSLLFGDGGLGPSQTVMEKEQPDVVNAHIQKLLDLRQKAQDLSRRLSGIRSAQKAPESQTSATKTQSAERAASGYNAVESVTRLPEREGDSHSQDNGARTRPTSLGAIDRGNEEEGTSNEAEDSDEDGADEEDDDRESSSGSDDGDTNIDAMDGIDEGEAIDDEGPISELQHRDAVYDAARYDVASAIADIPDALDIDVRSIGVYNIAVVWPLAHEHPSAEDSTRRFSEISSSASPSPSSQSDRSANDRDEERQSMRGAGGGHSASNSDNGSDLEVARSPRNSDRTRRTSEEWSAAKMSELMYSIDSMSKFSPGRSEYSRDERVGFATTTWRLDMDSAPSDAFYQLVQAEDDSLSVIQRTALKLYERQQERERLRRENEKQQHREQDTFDSPCESQESEHGDDSPARQFTRLNEIMQQVDRERSLERAATQHGESDDGEDGDSGDVDSDEASPGLVERIIRARGQVTASSEFWNRLLSKSAVQEGEDDDAEDEEERSRPLSGRAPRHVEIDTSELEEQHGQRLRLAEREMDGDFDDADVLDDPDRMAGQSRRRAHSPHTLAKRLLAEVEYHEAINDAHLKLTAMEQAQLLEQAQAETINIATAFKEEMEQNEVNHQLALDHATLAKRFDDDLHDVVQQLHGIKEMEEQEHTVREIAAEMQLTQARMRECSVQTEAPRVVDVGTSAPLHVDAGTSPIVPSASTAVQYEFSDIAAPVASPGSKLQVPIESDLDDEGNVSDGSKAGDSDAIDYGDEGFEQESGLHHSRSYGVQRGADAEDDEILSETGSVKAAAIHESSEAESVIESATSVTESNIVEGAHTGGDIEEEDYGISDAARSVDRSEADDHVESATAEYVDDFNASSLTAKAGRSLASSAVDEFGVESEYEENANRESDRSVEEVDVEDDDEPQDVAEAGHPTATDSGKDVTIEDNFEDEFAQSFDGEVEDEGELSEDDAGGNAGVDEGGEASLEYLAKNVHKAITKKPISRSAEPHGISAAYAPSAVTIEAHMRLPDTFISGFGHPSQFVPPPTSLYSLAAADAAQSEQVIKAYMAELERRKQSETSMLCLRLQATEAHFAHQAQRIDAAIAEITLDATAKAQLTARKQRLTIAFMGEKANIESLKAAATARYFQDMLAFRSLYANDSPSIAVADGVSRNLRDLPQTRATTAEVPVPSVPSRVESLPAKSSVGAESEYYEDEFASATHDNAEHVRSPIAESVEKSVIEDDDAHESEKQPSDGSVASEVEQVSQEQQSGDADNPQSDVDIESDFEQETQEKSVEEEEVQSDEYAQSEFEEETQDALEEQAIAEETTPQVAIDEDDQEPESLGVVSEINDADGEFDTSEVQEEDDGQVDSAKSDDSEGGGYDDDFASVSESVHRQEVGHASDEDAIVEEDVDHASGEADVVEENESKPSVATSEHEQEIALTDGEDEVNEAPDASACTSNAPASAAAYSEDGFEASGCVDDNQIVVSATFDVAESVAHSTSDDSSTTKLLMAEVDAVQRIVGGDANRNADVQSDKLMRKKAKVIELLEAKERLLDQQTRAFRLEEEKRMVNEAAHLALRLDVSQELREAKASVASELQSEFDALKMNFPKLKRLGEPSSVGEREAAVVADKPALQLTPPAVEQSAAIKGITESRENDDDEYEAQSFEDASESEADKSGREEDAEFPDDALIADNASDRVQSSVASENYSEFSEEESAAERDIPEGVGGAAADSIQSEVEEEQEQFEAGSGGDEGPLSDGDVESEDEGYENEYENESFADAQSAASVVDEDDAAENSQQSERVVYEAGDAVARSSSAIQSDAASEYTEDGFEQASESEAGSSVYSKENEEEGEEEGDVLAVFAADAKHQDEETAEADDAQSSVSDHELSAALATVAPQLDVDERDTAQNGTGAAGVENPPEHVLDRAEESTRELAACVLTPALESRADGHSLSTSSEQEILTKSIEERMARLEKLKTLILERQNEIRLVHKQLRIEKRKKELTAEEKALWAEVEGLEYELQCDVASLELVRQRNRLELNQLEARQQRASINPLGLERDLLLGFDYIEEVEPCTSMVSLQRDVDAQTPSGVEVECQTVAAPAFKEKVLTSSYLSDLLAGFDHVEYALEVVTTTKESVDRDDENAQAEVVSDFSIGKQESPVCDSTVIERPSSLRGSESAPEAHDALEEHEHPVDLLRDFAYVEAVEPLCALEVDLLAAFDYIEDVEPLVETPELLSLAGDATDHQSAEDSVVSGGEWLIGHADAFETPASGDHPQVEGEQSSAAVEMATPDMPPDDTRATKMQPESDDEVGEDGSFGDDADGDEASAPTLFTPQDLEGVDDGLDQEQPLDEDPETPAAATVDHIDDDGRTIHASSVNGEDATETADERTVHMISSLILADLLQDMGSDIHELRAWGRSRARVELSSAKMIYPVAMDTRTQFEPFKLEYTDRGHDEVDCAHRRDEIVSETLEAPNPAITTKETPRSTIQDEDGPDLAAQVDAATESIFSSVFDDVLLSQLRAGAARRTTHQQSPSMSTSTDTKDVVSSASTTTPSRAALQPQQVRGHANDSGVMINEATSRQHFIGQALATLQIDDNCIRLDAFSTLKPAGLAPDSARLLYDAIEEIGQSALAAHCVANATARPASVPTVETDEELLVALRQAIQREVETAYALQTELHESADRQLKALADTDDQLDIEDATLLRKFSARPTSVSNLITTAAPTWIARPPVTLSTSAASGSILTPRTPTPTSRGKSRTRRSLLTLARSRQAAELQRRVTSAIFDELLEDATTMVGQRGRPLR